MVELAVKSYFGNCVLTKHRPFDFEKAARIMKLERKHARENLRKLYDISLDVLVNVLEKTKREWDKEGRRVKYHKDDTALKMIHAANSYKYLPKIRMLEQIAELKKKLDTFKRDSTKDRIVSNYIKKIDIPIQEICCLNSYLNYKI